MTAPAAPSGRRCADINPWVAAAGCAGHKTTSPDDAAPFSRSKAVVAELETFPSLPSTEEQAALAAARGGDIAALHALLRRHVEPLLALARRSLRGDRHRAEDLVQETLLVACRSLVAFRGDASLRTWLFRILVRLAGDPGRWHGSPLPAGRLEPGEIPDGLAVEPEHATLARELHGRIAEAMERLPARQRTALHLRAVEGMGYAAIASVLGGSAGAARMLVLSARRTVRERLGQYLEESP
jgi:RNA polymerase sigma-70 factor (ECF subfamily)